MSLSIGASCQPASFVIGRTPAGFWILRDASGSQSGTFRSREAAVRYARLASGDRHAAVTLVTDGLEPIDFKRSA